MPTVTQVNDLKINKLTKAQYDAAVQAGTIGENEISIITDLDATPQVDSLPTADASTLGKIYQYIGATDANYTNGYFYKCVSDGAVSPTYSWTQIDVQPSSGGGDTSIDWKVVTDLPQDEYCYAPYYKVTGGLPDGDYEFYVQVKHYQGQTEYPYYTSVARFLAKVDTQNSTINMLICPVFDGSTATGEAIKLLDVTQGCSGKTVNGDLIFQLSGCAWGYTNVRDSGDYSEVKDCFKITDIKNINTGVKYTPAAYLVDPSEGQEYNHVSVNISQHTIDYHETVPHVYTYSGWTDVSEIEYLSLNGMQLSDMNYKNSGSIGCHIGLNIGSDLFDVKIDTFAAKYVATIIAASGVFSATQLFYNPTYENKIYIKLNLPNGTSGNINYSCGVSCGDDYTSLNVASNVDPNELLPVIINKVGRDIAPEDLGKIEQYNGTTTASYTDGYFYKANGTAVTVPASMDIRNVTSGYHIAISNPHGFAEAVANWMSWSVEDIENAMTSWHEWLFDIEFEAGEQPTLTWIRAVNGWGFSESSILSYITVTRDDTSTQGNQEISAEVKYNKAKTVVQNQSWDRVDVQPGSSLPSQTGNAGKFLTTDGTDASWSDKPLVNNTTEPTSLSIGGTSITYQNGVAVGKNAVVNGSSVSVGYTAKVNARNVAIGYCAESDKSYGGSVSIGYCANANITPAEWKASIAIGPEAVANADGSIQICSANLYNHNVNRTNSDANTFKVGNNNGNYEMMSADGTIPEARLADTTNAQQGDVLTLDANGNAVWQAGGGGSGIVATTGSLLVANWDPTTHAQTITVTGLTATKNVLVSPAPASTADYIAGGIICSGQLNDTLTFTCTTIPSADITVNMMIFD